MSIHENVYIDVDQNLIIKTIKYQIFLKSFKVVFETLTDTNNEINSLIQREVGLIYVRFMGRRAVPYDIHSKVK